MTNEKHQLLEFLKSRHLRIYLRAVDNPQYIENRFPGRLSVYPELKKDKQFVELVYKLTEVITSLRHKKRESLGIRLWMLTKNMPNGFVCSTCGVSFIPRYSILGKMYTRGSYYCSHKCSQQSPYTNLKKRETSINNYGVDHWTKVPELLESHMENIKSMTGYRTPFENPAVQGRIRKRSIEMYGTEHHLSSKKVRERASETLKDRTGYSHQMQNPQTRLKTINTNINRYGTINPMQNSIILHRQLMSSFNRKEYIAADGTVFDGLQGYEPQAIHWILNNKPCIRTKDIFVGEQKTKLLRQIPYKNISGHQSHYTVDIYIPKENRVVEVKSVYTLLHSKKDQHTYDTWTNNKLKRIAAINAGFNYSLLLIKANGERIPFPEYLWSRSIKKVLRHLKNQGERV